MKVFLKNPLKDLHVPTPKTMTSWVDAVVAHTHTELSIAQQRVTVQIADCERMGFLNEKYRGKKGPTNILSFPDEPWAGLMPDSLGDLVICPEVVIREAQEQNKLLVTHWAHLVIHGTLHLLGYDHMDDPSAEVMESLEIAILQTLGFPNPY